MVADELPEPVGPEFKKTFEQQNFGLPLQGRLIELADRMPLLDVRFFATAVTIQRETGGNLAEILDKLAYVVRERFKILRQVRVHTAHGRFTGYVLLALPAVLGIALSFISPDHMNTLFTEPIGQDDAARRCRRHADGGLLLDPPDHQDRGVTMTLLLPLLAFLFVSLLAYAACAPGAEPAGRRRTATGRSRRRRDQCRSRRRRGTRCSGRRQAHGPRGAAVRPPKWASCSAGWCARAIATARRCRLSSAFGGRVAPRRVLRCWRRR